MKSIILIGMPSSGKSTVGHIISQKTGIPQKDTDKMISDLINMSPKEIVEVHGREKFLQIQEKTVLENTFSNCIVSTGGGIIYSSLSMEHLKNFGLIYFLYSPVDELKARITTARKFSGNSGQTYESLFFEREPLYRKYADYILDCCGQSVNEIAVKLLEIHTKY